MKFRSIVISVFAVLMLAMTSVVGAQEFNPCFGLSEADCATLAEASMNGVGDASSFSVDYSFDFELAGIPDPTMSSVSFSTSGTLDLAEGTNPMLPVEASFSGTVQLPEDMGLEMTDIALEARLIDGIFYMQDPETGEWLSVDVIEAMSSPEFNEQLENLPFNPMTGEVEESLEGLEGMPDMEALLSLADLINLPGLVTYVREGDTFILTIDLTALQVLLEPEYEEDLNNIIEIASEIDPSMGFIIPMIPTLVNEGTIEVVQVLNPERNIIDTYELHINATIDMGMMTGDMEAEPITTSLNFSLSLNNFDAVELPVAPEGATPIDVSESGF